MKMQKVDFVFEYEVKPREFNSVCLLAAYLQSKGYSVAVLNSWQSLYQKPKAYDAVVAVISACYNDGTYDFFTGHIASFQKVVNMQWEQVLINHYYQPCADETYVYQGAGRYTSHICWGEKEKNWLETAFKIEKKYLKVLGYLPLDFYRPEFRSLLPSREQLFSQYGLDPQKRTLLFVSSFSAIGLPSTEDHGDDKLFPLLSKVSNESQDILLKWFGHFAKEHPQVQIIYRYHPTEKDSPLVQSLSCTHENVYAIANLPVSYWITACDKLYNWDSTSMVEMLYSGKDTYLIRPIAVPDSIDFQLFEGAHCITSYEEFEQSALEPKMGFFPVPPHQVMQWYEITEEPVYRRIGDYLIELYNSDSYASRPPAVNMHGFTQYTFKKELKSLLVHGGMDKVFACFCGRRIAEKMDRIRKGVISEDNYSLAKREKGGYIQSRVQLNGTSEQEIQETIAKFQKIITQQEQK